MKITLKRVYDAPSPVDGRRILVERLWPRGIKKEALKVNGWMRDVAPSTSLRKWFSHDPTKWVEFQRRYYAELDSNPQPWTELLQVARKEPVTLLFSSHDTEHNNVVALRAYLMAKRQR